MKKKLFSLVMCLLLLCLTLTGCGGSAKNSGSTSSAITGGTSGKGDYFYQEDANFNSAVMDSMTATGQAAPSVPEEKPQDGGATDSDSTQDSTQTYSKLIYRADMYLETTAFDSVAQSLDGIVSSLGGYFENHNVSNYGTYRNSYYVIRIPAEHFDQLLSQVGQLCLVRSQNKSSENVSEVYYDLEARLTTQRTKLERLQELLRQAESMEDIITIESAISDTELQIEYLTGSLRHYDSLISYSTVTINLQEVYKLSNVEEAPAGFADRLANALGSGLRNGIDATEDFIIGLAYNWMGLLILLAMAAVVLLVVRHRLHKRKERLAPPPPTEDKKDPNS